MADARILVALPEGGSDVQLLEGLLDYGFELVVARKASEAREVIERVHQLEAVVVDASLGHQALVEVLGLLAAPERAHVASVILGHEHGVPAGAWTVLATPLRLEHLVLVLNQITTPRLPMVAVATAAHRPRAITRG